MNIEKQEVLKILNDNKIMCVISWTSRNSILLIGQIFLKTRDTSQRDTRRNEDQRVLAPFKMTF